MTQFYHGVPYPDGTTYFGGTQDNGTLRGTDGGGGHAWQAILGGDGGYVAVDPTNTNVLYAENTGLSIQKSTNGGASFFDAITGITRPTRASSSSRRSSWTPGTRSGCGPAGWYIWRTDNGAAYLGARERHPAGQRQRERVAVSPVNPNNAVLVGHERRLHGAHERSRAASTSATVLAVVRPRTGYVSWTRLRPARRQQV